MCIFSVLIATHPTLWSLRAGRHRSSCPADLRKGHWLRARPSWCTLGCTSSIQVGRPKSSSRAGRDSGWSFPCSFWAAVGVDAAAAAGGDGVARNVRSFPPVLPCDGCPQWEWAWVDRLGLLPPHDPERDGVGCGRCRRFRLVPRRFVWKRNRDLMSTTFSYECDLSRQFATVCDRNPRVQKMEA